MGLEEDGTRRWGVEAITEGRDKMKWGGVEVLGTGREQTWEAAGS